MNSYTLSNGDYIKKSVIDARVRKAKAEKLADQFEEYNYNFCENPTCGRSSGVRLDCAHTISVDACQKAGKAEFAYDKNNIRILCRNCHQLQDGLYLDF